jgi:hypothetical protein
VEVDWGLGFYALQVCEEHVFLTCFLTGSHSKAPFADCLGEKAIRVSRFARQRLRILGFVDLAKRRDLKSVV